MFLAGGRVEKIAPDGTISIVAGNGTNAPATNGPALGVSMDGPSSVDVGKDGTLYIADATGGKIVKVKDERKLLAVQLDPKAACARSR